MSILKILVIPGSLHAGSSSARLASAMTHELALAHIEVTRISLADYPLPIFEDDLAQRSNPPKHAVALKRMVGAHHGVFIASPEYNAALPPLLQNAIAWMTGVQERNESQSQVLRDRVVAIGAASEDASGGRGALMTLRHTLTLGCGALVVPEQIALAFAGEAFDEMDRLKAPDHAEMLRSLARQLIHLSQQMM